MRFQFHRVDSLPKLAWCAVLRRSDPTVHVVHGPWVETCDEFFVEGAWDGAYKEGRFDRSSTFMGFGGRINQDTIIFSTPCEILEKLHIYKTGDCAYISPSMVFLLKMAKRRLDVNYIGYEYDLTSQLKGLKAHVGDIPLDNGDRMRLCRYRNLEIHSNLDIHIHHKPEPPGFRDFAGYKNFLIKRLVKLKENACDPGRTIHYSPLTTISSGYDSCACSAIALEIGCTEAATIRTARDQYNHAEDSGTKIGEQMGLRVHEFEQDAYIRLPGLPEAEFVAMGGGGPDVIMAPMAELFSRRFVITGIHGDTVWERHKGYNIARDISRQNLHHATLTEFRLRTGFIHVPLPFFGSLNVPDIRAISNSEEMRPWCVGGDYDRPIARRLVEEKGIERMAFGQRKLATTTPMSGTNLQQMQNKMTLQSFDSFFSFYKEQIKKRPLPQRLWYVFIFQNYKLTQWPVLRRLFPSLKYFDRVRIDQEPFRLHWGIAMIEDRYEIKEGWETHNGQNAVPALQPSPVILS